MISRLAILLALVLAACGPGTSGVTSPSSTLPPATTTTSATATTLDTDLDPAIVFEEVDRGVATDIRLFDKPGNELPSPPGTLEWVACRTTWFGNYEFEFDWDPAAATNPGRIDVTFLAGDSALGLVSIEAELSGPGRFVVPVSNLDIYRYPDDNEWSGHTGTIDEAADFTCLATVGASDLTAPLTVVIKPPLPLHPADTVQGIIERMDPTEPDELYRPLAALAASLPDFPLDRVYLVPEATLDSMTYEEDGACSSLESAYRSGVYLSQHLGCLDGQRGGTLTDTGWTVDADGVDIDQLDVLLWWGHPGVEGPKDRNDFLDDRDLPDGTTEVYRAEVAGIFVSVLRSVATNGTITYLAEGLGDAGGGGGFPGEIWNGCYQVQYQDAGYSMVVVADPSWSVTIDEERVEVVDVGDAGVVLVPVVVRSPAQLGIATSEGTAPQCLSQVD